MQKSKSDKRQYKHFILENGMKVLVISDSAVKKGTCSLNVGVGAYNNPKEKPGLAHFLEHLLFMGSKKYPKENYFIEQIKVKNGEYNGGTSATKTNYHFSIPNDYLDHTLDIFSRFFIDPLFSKDAVDRELNAVNNEFKTKYNDDDRRVWQLYDSLTDEKIPIATFTCGNKESLTCDNLRDLTVEFYHKHYSSDKMSLVVLGNYKIEILEKMVRDKFSDVKRIETKKSRKYI